MNQINREIIRETFRCDIPYKGPQELRPIALYREQIQRTGLLNIIGDWIVNHVDELSMPITPDFEHPDGATRFSITVSNGPFEFQLFPTAWAVTEFERLAQENVVLKNENDRIMTGWEEANQSRHKLLDDLNKVRNEFASYRNRPWWKVLKELFTC